jgi:DNA-binding NtrC family response regulator
MQMAKNDKGRPVLVVDDSEATREVLRRNLEAEGYAILTAPGVAEALALLENTPVDLVVTDIKMPRVSGHDLVRHVRENLKDTEVMVITGHPDVNGAVAAMKDGATDYLTKPFTDEELISAVRRAVDKLDLRRVDQKTGARIIGRHGLLGASQVMEKIFRQIERASRTAATVLVSGESGTGKELVARAIHYESGRASAPFVPVNCGAIPHELLESELFGHVKGSFTGATESRAGFFLTADGGTIFLDEVGGASPAMQVKLLRVL